MPNNQYISPEKIRLFMLDRTKDDNFLLDDREMSDETLSLAQEMVVDKYNTQAPFVQIQYTVETFPFKYEFLLGVTAFCLLSKVLNMKRNQLNYSSASGTAIDDKKTSDEYLALAGALQKEFDSRVEKIKAAINEKEGYGFAGSQFAWSNGYGW